MKKSHNISYLLFIALFFFLGIGMVVWGAFIVNNNNQKLKNYPHVPAVVVDHKISEHMDEDGYRYNTYAEIVEYTVNGRVYRATNPVSTSSGFKKIGAVIDIAYNPQNPAECVFNTKSNKFGYGLLIGLGAAFFLASCAMLFGYIKGRRSAGNTSEVYYADTENFT